MGLRLRNTSKRATSETPPGIQRQTIALHTGIVGRNEFCMISLPTSLLLTSYQITQKLVAGLRDIDAQSLCLV